MRYMKPIVIALKGRLMDGQENPQSCYAGDSPGGFGVCGAGAGGYGWAGICQTGHSAGGDPSETLCLAGGSTEFCDAGAGGAEFGDDCTVGPSNA